MKNALEKHLKAYISARTTAGRFFSGKIHYSNQKNSIFSGKVEFF